MEEFKTPAQWCDDYGVIILDPDGWRGTRYKDWSEPITREEFMQRCFMSTIDATNSDILKDF